LVRQIEPFRQKYTEPKKHEKRGVWWLGLAMVVTTMAIASIHHEPELSAPVTAEVNEQSLTQSGTAQFSADNPEPDRSSQETDQIRPMSFQQGKIEPAPPTDAQTDIAIDATDAAYWKKVSVKRGDSLAAILYREQILEQDINDIILLKSKALRNLYPRQVIHLRVSQDKRLLEAKTDLSLTETLHVFREAGVYQLNHQTVELETRIAYASGEIKHSLFLSGQKAGLGDALIMEMAEIFAWDIDFALDIRDGDRFTVAYEEKYRYGEKVGNGIIVAAEFVNGGTVHRSIAHRDQSGTVRYYTPEGDSMRRAFLKTPVKFSRISSRFTGKRYHPVLKRWRAHQGVDYSAPTGTPIRATAQGKIIFKGRKGGYGNTIIVKHGGSYSTLYAHMSRFAGGMRSGKTVEQGQVIGYVGKTGLATGPHLHYEFRVRDVHRNPLTFKFPKAESIPAEHKTVFLQQAQFWTEQLEIAANKTQVAGNL